jgi:steroid delta-isomerase-like uncharacterized protein
MATGDDRARDDGELTRKGFIEAGAAGAAGAGMLGLPPAAAAADEPGRAARRKRALWKRREAVVRKHLASENRKEFDETLDTFDAPRYELIAQGAVYDGPEAVAQYFRDSRTAFPDQRNRDVRLRRAEGDGRDAIVIEFELRGTHLGPLQGFGATGRSFSCRMCAFFFFAKGGDKIVTERVYFDAGTILQQLGIIPTLYPGWRGPLRK